MATYEVHMLTWSGGATPVLTDQGAFTTLGRNDGYSASKVRNGIGDLSFTCSIWDQVAIDYLNMGNIVGQGEVQVLRDSTVIWQGPPVAMDASLASQQVTVHCRTLEHYLSLLLFGKAERDNLFANGDFEASGVSLTSWTTVGTTATVETSIVNSGARAAKLVGLGHIYQDETGITHSYDPGLAYRLAGYVNISAATALALGDEFVLARLVANNGTREYVETLTVGDLDRFDDYTRFSFDILLGADDTWDVRGKLEGNAAGNVYFDDVLFTRNEAVTVGFPGDDLTVLVENIISHAQDTGFGKKDLLLTVDPTTTGITLIKGYAFADHENIWDALQALCKEFNCDIWIDLDRVVHVVPVRGSAVAAMDRNPTVDPSSPTRESDFRALTELGDLSVTVDASQQRTTIIVGAEASDFAREEAGAGPFATYVASEEYIVAPPSTKVRDLQVYADSLLGKFTNQPVFPSLTYPWADAGTAEPGDMVDLAVSVGCIQFDTTYRIETWAVNMVTDTVQCVFDIWY